MVKSNTFRKYAKKESANVRKCLRDNKLKTNTAKAVEYVSNKRRGNKKHHQKKMPGLADSEHEGSESGSDNEDGDDDEKLPNGRPQPLPKNAKVEFPTFETMPTATNFVRLHDAGQLSRLVYLNPVCFLTTVDPDGSKRNVMTLSWLCPANNYGGFVFVIHKTRFSASNITHHKTFNLSVANASQLELLSAIGKCTGKGRDKFDGSIEGLASVAFGRYSNDQIDADDNKKMKWEYLPENAKEIQSKSSKNARLNPFGALDDSSDDESENEQSDDKEEPKESKESNRGGSAAVADSEANAATSGKKVKDPQFIQGSIAHLRCTVQSMTDAADAGHYLVVANITEAAVHPQYWSHKGKCLAPTVKELPSIVSFLGSQQFGTTNPL